MIFSRQVNVCRGMFLKHHVFPVGNRCGILVSSIPLRQTCVGKEGLSSWRLQNSWKEIYYYMFWKAWLHTLHIQQTLKYHCACREWYWCMHVYFSLSNVTFNRSDCTLQNTVVPKMVFRASSSMVHDIEYWFCFFLIEINNENQELR